MREKWSHGHKKYVFNSETGEFYFGNFLGLAALVLSIAGAYFSKSGTNPLVFVIIGIVCGIAGIVFGFRSLADAVRNRLFYKGSGAVFGILCSLFAIVFSVFLTVTMFMPAEL